MAKITIENVVPVIRNGEIKKFQTSISAFGLAKMYQGDVIRYVPDIQRGSKELKSGKIVDVFSAKHVREILEAMLKDECHGGVLTLNYAEENEDQLEYNEKTRKLTGKGYFQILDGQHRVRACEKWVELWEKDNESYPDPNQFYFPCTVEELNNENAKTLFSEYCTTALKISPSRSSYLNVSDYSNKIARTVMNQSDLNGKVELVSTTIKKESNKVVTFAVLTNAIKNNFNPSSKNESNEIGEYLVEYFDTLIELFPNALKTNDWHTRRDEKSKSFSAELITFNAYLAIAKALMGREDWKNRLNRLNDVVAIGSWQGNLLDKSNPMWQPILRDGDKVVNSNSTTSLLTRILVEYVVNEKPVSELAAS